VKYLPVYGIDQPVDEHDHAVIDSPELPIPVFLDHGVTGAHGTTLWVAIRPEKIDGFWRSSPEFVTDVLV